MTNVKGTVVVPDAVDTLVDHRARIRELEAQRGNLNDDPFVALTVNLNGWTDTTFANPFYANAPVGYVITANSWLGLRGRVANGREGKAALRLPVEVRPRYDRWFAVDVGTGGTQFADSKISAASHVGHVVVTADGYVIPYIDPPGFGAYSPNNVIDGFVGSGGIVSAQPPYVQPLANLYEVLAAGGLGINVAIATLVNSPLIYPGWERFIDGEVWATITADCTDVLLGQRCQWYPGLTFAPSPGYYMELGMPNSPNLRIHVVNFNVAKPSVTPDISTYTFNAGTVPAFINPGFAAGDTIRFQMINNTVYLFKGPAASNDPPIFSAVELFSSNVPVLSSGHFAVGCNGPGNTALLTAWGGGMPRKNSGVGSAPLGASLDQVFYKIGA